MLKKFIFIAGLSSLVNASSFHWQLDMYVKPEKGSLCDRFVVILNGQNIKCHCGKPPVYVFFYYAMPVCYCPKHMPLPQHTNEIDFQEILAKGMKDEQEG